MTSGACKPLSVAIACGGTGGHFFPGLAVGEELLARGCRVTLLVSRKEVDQRSASAAAGMTVDALPAVAWQRNPIRFLAGLRESYRAARRLFAEFEPAAVLSMGGFTGVGPALAARRSRVPVFLHEANSLPGRANRWLAHVAEGVFVYFPDAAGRISHQQVRVTGMPVRSQFEPADAAACRAALRLDPHRAVLLVMGGSQGAEPINQALLAALPELSEQEPDLQFIHLTGANGVDAVAAAYRGQGRRAFVAPFLTEMELAFGAATLAVTRAGASSLAEQAAMRLPAILIPYPHAADNHQYFNARAFADSGAACLLRQAEATPERLLATIRALLADEPRRRGMQVALRQWHCAAAARTVAEIILRRVRPQGGPAAVPASQPASLARLAAQPRPEP
ncbi:MAG: undecaprenyldiphospho-muramoylpentapeptide beta-N-acetylglucosaminyltransferase [Verrucomicrobia bacterium]|nr:undecaprenyldiphospho-muramoylpentapeptide beta-N-acetylglucosaminyltransferase [Verrucomicrobiota bacterium]